MTPKVPDSPARSDSCGQLPDSPNSPSASPSTESAAPTLPSRPGSTRQIPASPGMGPGWIAALKSWIRQGRLPFPREQGRTPSGISATSETKALVGLKSENPHCRWESAAYLGRNAHRSTEAVAALVAALADPEEFVRWQAAKALAAQEASHSFAILVAALDDPEPLRRAGAAEAMGYQGGEAASVTLCRHLTDPESRVRGAVALALRDLADPSAVPCLLPHLADENADVRRAVASALGRIADPTTAKPMADALSEPGQPLLVRRALAAALVRTAHPEAKPALLAALSDSDPQVRGYAAEALRQIGDETARAALSATAANRGGIHGTAGSRVRQALTKLERWSRRSH